ncbi:MAG TPA: hypothetical protein VK864_08910 [Longimicrobiales bacterium]|nr:hypothetical protein [Longimicrobiales bacterium]
MQSNPWDPAAEEFLPPAVTRRTAAVRPEPEAPLVEPFRSAGGQPVPSLPAEPPLAESGFAAETGLSAELVVEPEPVEAAEPFAYEEILDDASWFPELDEAGVAEAVVAEPETPEPVVSAEAGPALHTFHQGVVESSEEFPLEAFVEPASTAFVPEAEPLEEIEEVAQSAWEADATNDLANRFELLSRRLRNEEIDSLLRSLARGDRLDTLVAGLLAGYLSARNV